MLFQLYAGYDETETRIEQTAHTLSIDSVPSGATVKELDGGEQIHLGNTPLKKEIEYTRELTITRPANMWPYWVGVAIDAALVVAGIFVVREILEPKLYRSDLWLAYGQFPLYWVGEVVVGGVVANRDAVVTRTINYPVSYALLLQKEGRPEVEARLEIPTSGNQLIIPLEVNAAKNIKHSGLILIATGTSSTSTVGTSTTTF